MSQFPIHAPLSPTPPWHMWGNAVDLRIDSTGLDPDRPVLKAQQVVKVSYKRPDSWSFFFGGRLKGVQPYGSAAFVSMQFDIFTGIGRSVFQTGPQPFIPPDAFSKLAFCKFVWAVPLNAIGSTQPVKYTTVVDTPRMDDRVPEGDGTIRQIECLPAQDIQVSVQLIVLPILLPTPLVYEAEAHAYFAPRSHVRPDWIDVDAPPNVRFRGEELGGT